MLPILIGFEDAICPGAAIGQISCVRYGLGFFETTQHHFVTIAVHIISVGQVHAQHRDSSRVGPRPQRECYLLGGSIVVDADVRFFVQIGNRGNPENLLVRKIVNGGYGQR